MDNCIKVCLTCQHHKLELERGVLCALVDEKPDFDRNCPDFELDKEAEEREYQKQLRYYSVEELEHEPNPDTQIFMAWVLGILGIAAIIVNISGYNFYLKLGAFSFIYAAVSAYRNAVKMEKYMRSKGRKPE